MEKYEPNSTTAVLATILAKLESQGRVQAQILEQTTLTNGRVTKLEKWRDSYVARASGIALAASMGAAGVAWVANLLFSAK